MFAPIGLEALDVEMLPRVQVGDGCTRIELPSRGGVRIWIVDMKPGSEWPLVDSHGGGGEDVFVVSGEVIEGEARYGPGAFLKYGPHSRHRPRTEAGARLFGLNVQANGDGASM